MGGIRKMSIYGIFERERISGNFWHSLLATFQIKKKREEKLFERWAVDRFG